MEPGHGDDRPGGPRGQGEGGGTLYAWEVELFRRSREGTYSREDFGTVRATSLLAAYTRKMEEAVRRARDPEDGWYGSEFAYPRGISRRLRARPEPRQGHRGTLDRPAAQDASSGSDGAPDTDDPDFDSLADTYR